jgi:hypothetical protein
MKPFRFQVDRLIDFGTIVSMVGTDAVPGNRSPCMSTTAPSRSSGRPGKTLACRSPSSTTPTA